MQAREAFRAQLISDKSVLATDDRRCSAHETPVLHDMVATDLILSNTTCDLGHGDPDIHFILFLCSSIACRLVLCRDLN